MLPLTEQQKRYRTAAIAENHTARVLRGKRLSHKHEFDVETATLLIEVKAISRKQWSSTYPKIHISRISKEYKDDFAIQKGKIAILVACKLYRNKVTEMRFGPIKCHCRYNSLLPFSDLAGIFC
jgi:hypothetical protein